jgi:hypothetical protein
LKSPTLKSPTKKKASEKKVIVKTSKDIVKAPSKINKGKKRGQPVEEE